MIAKTERLSWTPGFTKTSGQLSRCPRHFSTRCQYVSIDSNHRGISFDLHKRSIVAFCKIRNSGVWDSSACVYILGLSLILDVLDSSQSQQGVDASFKGIALGRGKNEPCIA